jgi:hypothetical protein
VFRAHERPGLISALFFLGYGTFRFICEFFREPDYAVPRPISMGMALSIPVWLRSRDSVLGRHAPAHLFKFRRVRRPVSLKARIAALIEAQGPMSVAQFMTISLLDPKCGYYATRDPLGAGGDFTTAPEISQMFGEMIGLWLVQAWSDQGCPRNPRLVELGPGRGTLMADILRTAKVAPEFLTDLEVVLIEASPTLQQVQADKLRSLGADICWQAQFDDSLTDRPLFLVANEFFDALALRQYVKTDRGWCERMVTVLNDELSFALAPVPAPPPPFPRARKRARRRGVMKPRPPPRPCRRHCRHLSRQGRSGADHRLWLCRGERLLRNPAGGQRASFRRCPGRTRERRSLRPCGFRRPGRGGRAAARQFSAR